MKKVIIKTPPPDTVIAKVIGLLDKYVDTTGAILEDYVADRSMILELVVADGNLRREIEALDDDALDFEQLLEKVAEHEDFDPEKLLEIITDHKCYDSELLLKKLDDESEVESYLSEKGYAIIKVQNFALREKLETFLHAEIYPLYRDQQEFINL